MAKISIENLHIFFSQATNHAVNGISFSIEEGTTLGVVGESGSGKSLTGLAIMGLLPKEAKVSGKIIFNSMDLLQLPEEEKQNIRGSQISMIFQEPMTALNPVITCGRQVDEILRIHTSLDKNQRIAKVLELFAEVMLPDPEMLYRKYPHQLSGGQRQRVMIAMAIACKPKLLIADEPTTALDVTVQAGILQLLKQLQLKHKLSMLFISHDLNIIAQVSDRILVMKRGEQIEIGEATEILKSPKQAYTQGLIKCKPNSQQRPVRLPVVEDFLQGKGEDISFVSKEERAGQHEIIYSKTPVLLIKNINAYFNLPSGSLWGKKKTFHALKNIDMQIWKGETLGLVGESGSGKSTLGRSIMKLVENVQGEILFNERDISKLDKKEFQQFRKKVQLVFQDPYSSLTPHITIGHAIMEPMTVYGIYTNQKERKEKVLELMGLTGLQLDWFGKYPHQLSGGQRQRVVIARALALGPEILICDESVSALDVSVQAQILNLLNDLKQQLGLTYIFISHDLSVVKYMSDRIFVLRNGQFEEFGEADQVYENPRSEYTKALIRAAFN